MRISKIYFAVIALIFFTSCSGIDKLIKSRDYEKQYSEALRYYHLKKDNRAITLFNNLEQIFTGTDRIDTIKFYTAKAHYRQGDFKISQDLFNEFRKIYTRSVFSEEAEYLYAMSFFESSPNPELDQTDTGLGIMAFKEYLDRYPDSPKKEACEEMIEELRERLYDKAFMVANTYFNVGYYNSAIHSFKNVLKEHPEIPQREMIMFQLVRSNYLYAKSSVHAKQRERYLNTMDSYYNFISEYPESNYRKEADRLFNTSQKLANVTSKRPDETTQSTTRKIIRQEKRSDKVGEKADKQDLPKKDGDKADKAYKTIEKKLDKINAKIAKEKSKEESANAKQEKQPQKQEKQPQKQEKQTEEATQNEQK